MKKNKIIASVVALSMLVGIAVPAFAVGEPTIPTPEIPVVDATLSVRPNGPWNDEQSYDYNAAYNKYLKSTSVANQIDIAVDDWAVENLEEYLDDNADEKDYTDGMEKGLVVDQTKKAYVGIKVEAPTIGDKTPGAVFVGGKFLKLAAGGDEANGGGGIDTFTGDLIIYAPFAIFAEGEGWKAFGVENGYSVYWYENYDMTSGSTTQTALGKSEIKIKVDNKVHATGAASKIAARPDYKYTTFFKTDYATTKSVSITPIMSAIKNEANKDDQTPMIAFKNYEADYEYLTYGVEVAAPTGVTGFKVACVSNGLFRWDEVNKAKTYKSRDAEGKPIFEFVGSNDPIPFGANPSLNIRQNGAGDIVSNSYYQYVPVAKRKIGEDATKWIAMPEATYNLKFKWYGGNSDGTTYDLPITVKSAPINADSIEMTDKTVDTKSGGKVNLDYIFKPVVKPTNASDKNIVWSYKSGGTGVSILDGILNVGTVAGDITVTATITNVDGTKITKDVKLTTDFKQSTVTFTITENAGTNGFCVEGVLVDSTTGTINNVPYGTYSYSVYNHATKGSATAKVEGTLVVDATTEAVSIAFPAKPVVPVTTPTDNDTTGTVVGNVAGTDKIVDGTIKGANGQPVAIPADAAKIAVETKVDVTKPKDVDSASVTEKKILEALDETQIPAVTLEIGVELTTTGAISGNLTNTAVAETPKPLTFSIVLPIELQGKGPFTVYRNHNGVVKDIPNTYDAKSNTITFSSNLFSTYMIVQGTPKVSPGPAPRPDYGRPSYSGSASTPSDTTAALSVNSPKGTEVTVASGVTNLTDPTADVREVVINTAEAKAFVDSAAKSGFAFAKMFDINMFDGKTKVTKVEGGMVKISIPFNGDTKYTYNVLRLNADGGITAMPTEYKDGKITFTTNHFSLYAIAVQSTNKNLFADTTIKGGATGTTSVPQTSVVTLGKLF